MTCTILPTIETCLDCQIPFSFYFDVVGTFWRHTAPGGNSSPLHRICTLARKQGATFLATTPAANRADVLAEIEDLDAASGSNGTAEAIQFTFFRSASDPRQVDNLTDDDVLGYAVLINYKAAASTTFTNSYIYEAVLKSPAQYVSGQRKPLLNNFIYRDAEFPMVFCGREFKIRGVYYCQQNQKTSCCAHAGLRMSLNTIGVPNPVTTRAINAAVAPAAPGQSLNLQQIEQVITQQPNIEGTIIDCTMLPDGAYLSVLASVLESGDMALLVFTTVSGIEHVVTVFGHTKNSDEWHPQAIPAYSGPASAQYYASSSERWSLIRTLNLIG